MVATGAYSSVLLGDLLAALEEFRAQCRRFWLTLQLEMFFNWTLLGVYHVVDYAFRDSDAVFRRIMCGLCAAGKIIWHFGLILKLRVVDI